MRKIFNTFFVLAAVLCAAGCNEAEMVRYENGGQVNLYGWYYPHKESWELDSEAFLRKKFNFGVNPKGEKLMYDTLKVGVRLMGMPVDHDRDIIYKLVAETDNVIELETIPEETYFMPAGEAKVTVKYLVKRVATRNEVYKAKWMVDYDRTEFTPGSIEKQAFSLEFSDIVTPEVLGFKVEESWDWYADLGVLFGYSETKMRFIITTLGITDIPGWLDNFGPYWDAEILQDALDEYRADPSTPPLYDETKLPEQEWIYFI